MLLLSPVFYYEKIRERFANSYLAEDTTQTIIGIDCEYISSEQTDFAGLKSYFKAHSPSIKTLATRLLRDCLECWATAG